MALVKHGADAFAIFSVLWAPLTGSAPASSFQLAPPTHHYGDDKNMALAYTPSWMKAITNERLELSARWDNISVEGLIQEIIRMNKISKLHACIFS